MVILAEGFEEMEAIVPIDVLRRAGVRVAIVGLKNSCVKSSRGIGIQTDVLFRQIQDLPDAVVLPGGLPGASNLAQSLELKEFLNRMDQEKKIIAAICAAPAAVLAPLGILDGKKATCYPGCEADFSKTTRYVQQCVVTDGHLVTSQGPGTALEFSLELVKQLVGSDMARTLSEKMLARAQSS